ncbi:hypothetical protein RvY_00880 [Ramazzottius varieornatus]|uniref:Uncharacterized protein n=1 Tax=Ramazzottius varieornatus TaxID=947166 RepID=A0A1D1UPP1_RAMVA|nr:hypothetical protein RvY_00880 [Ramazzottius varieornatus]
MADAAAPPVQNSVPSRRETGALVASRKETGEMLADILVEPATGGVTDVMAHRRSSTKKPCPFPKRKAGSEQQQQPRNSLPPERGPRYTDVFMDTEAVLNELRKHSIS